MTARTPAQRAASIANAAKARAAKLEKKRAGGPSRPAGKPFVVPLSAVPAILPRSLTGAARRGAKTVTSDGLPDIAFLARLILAVAREVSR